MPRCERTRLLNFELVLRTLSRVVVKPADLPPHVKQRVSPPLPEVREARDFAGALENGVEWLFANWKTHQPEAFEALMAQEPSLVYAESLHTNPVNSERVLWEPLSLVRLANGCIVVHPDYRGNALEQGDPRHPCVERYRALPEAIGLAYYGRVLGFEIAHELPLSPTDSRVLPAHMSAWKLAEDICERSRKARANMTAALRAVTADAASVEDVTSRFSVVLDTREQGDYSRQGSFLLVDERSDKQRVYYVRDGDFLTFGELESPGDVVDRYVANVLRGSSTPFDFSPHVRH